MSIRVITWNKPRQPTEKELREMLEREGMKPFTTVMEKNEFTSAQENKYDETRVILSGKIDFCAEGRSHILKPGDRIDMAPSTVYTIRNLEKGQSVMLCAIVGGRVYIEKY